MTTYRINTIFYSLQGEGANTGRAAVFVRFAGCNLRCPFCDTEFDTYLEMSADDIITKVNALAPHPTHPSPLTSHLSPLIVLTGGEPTLQVDEALVDLFHQHSYEVAMESNGTRPAPRNLDWLTISPKFIRGEWQEVRGERLPDEVKIVYDGLTDPASILSSLTSHLSPLTPHLFLQPCDTGDDARNAFILKACVDYIKQHPEWRLSLQTHKLIGIE